MADKILNEAGVAPPLEQDELVEVLEGQVTAVCRDLLARVGHQI